MFGIPKPTTIITAAAFVVGASIGAFGVSMTYEKAIVPGREAAAAEAATEKTRDRLTAAMQIAAEAARAAQTDRLRLRYEAAMDLYVADLTASKAALEAAAKERAERDEAYEQQLSAIGKECDLDANDIDYIVGVRPELRGE